MGLQIYELFFIYQQKYCFSTLWPVDNFILPPPGTCLPSNKTHICPHCTYRIHAHAPSTIRAEQRIRHFIAQLARKTGKTAEKHASLTTKPTFFRQARRTLRLSSLVVHFAYHYRGPSRQALQQEVYEALQQEVHG